jgi:AraC-like DNA-binding protein
VRKSPARVEREANPRGRSTPALGRGKTKLQRQIEAAERATKAMKLRTMRHSWDTIAAQCGYSSRGAAATAVKRELARIPREAAHELRISELETLDAAQRAIATQIAGGSFGAIDRMLKIMDARAKLTGLYEDIVDTGVEEVRDVLAAWLGEVRKRAAVDDLEDELESGDLSDSDETDE